MFWIEQPTFSVEKKKSPLSFLKLKFHNLGMLYVFWVVNKFGKVMLFKLQTHVGEPVTKYEEWDKTLGGYQWS